METLVVDGITYTPWCALFRHGLYQVVDDAPRYPEDDFDEEGYLHVAKIIETSATTSWPLPQPGQDLDEVPDGDVRRVE